MMRKLLLLLMLCTPLLAYNQAIGLCGMSSNSSPGDGCSFVLGENIAAGTKIYITDADYDDATNAPVIGGDEVLEYTFAVNKNKGEVITIIEGSTSNTFDINCSSGTDCGSVSIVVGSSWSVSVTTEPITIFTDSDNDGDPTTGTIEVLSFAAHTSYLGGNPASDFPNAIVITGLTSGVMEYPSASRSGSVTKADLENNSNWTTVTSFSTTAFSSVSLPVEFTYFKGQATTAGALLQWQTATEKNNEGFNIERSIDGRNWETIGFVQGHGTTQETQNYFYTDETPLASLNYYRLKQMDFDGAFEYSSIVNVNYELGIKNDELAVFPNPVQYELNIVNGEGIATIYNVLGQPVKEFSINNEQLTIDVKDLPKGQYILRISQQNGNVVTRQFLK